MKLTYALWSAIFLLTWFVGPGFFFALLITGIAATASISTGVHAIGKLEDRHSFRELR